MEKLAAAYIRVSTEDQAEYSPDAQRRALSKWAAEHGCILLTEHIYVDEGISGRSAAKRPAFQRMVAAARSTPRPFDVILVHKFDRFARSREDSIIYKSILQRECGVQVISITETIDDGGSGMGVLMEAISEAYAEFYSVNLGREVKKGMSEKARRGGLQAIPPFGYAVDDNVLVPVPAEADIVREIFSRFVSGEGLSSIARNLSERGIRTHRGNAFEHRTVEYILRNPVYIGKLRWNPSGRSGRHFDHPDIILADAVHEPLIDMDTWESAQRRAAEIKQRWGYKARPASELHDWLCGVVRCAACGSTLVYSAPHYMKCNSYVKGRCRSSQHVRVDLLHDVFLARLRLDMAGTAPLNVSVSTLKIPASPSFRLEQQITETERRLSRLRDAYLAGIEDLDSYAASKRQLEASLTSLRAELNAASPMPSEDDIMASMRRSIAAAYDTLTSDDATIPQKNDALRSIISRMTWDRDSLSLDIEYRLTP